MGVLAGEGVTRQWTLRRFDTGQRSDADSLPTGVLVRNGADTGETVTIENVSTGVYKWSITIPADWVKGDEVDLRITATVNSVTFDHVVWRSTVVTSITQGG